jgi:hypothetical protein
MRSTTIRVNSLPAVAVVLALATGACGSEKLPSGPSTSSLAPGSIVQKPGWVFDTAYRPLAGARVEIVDGPSTGASATTDRDGLFYLSVPEDQRATVRAGKEGYVSAESSAVSWWFTLRPVAPSVSIEPGEYTLAFSTDSGCAVIPDDQRARTFPATIAPALDLAPANMYRVTVNDPTVRSYFVIGVAGDRVGIPPEDGAPALYWQAPPFRYFQLNVFDVLSQPSMNTERTWTISMAFNLWYCEARSEVGAGICFNGPVSQVVTRGDCRFFNNRLTLTRP